MSYQVLARKWRPANFDELIGQQQTSQALINALESQRLHHAYLFTGTRGVGKTTIARILSKSLNCEKGITSKPCGSCSSCVEITQGNFVDLLEIDAASKTKVEDTRELLENVQYRPTRGRYKVYLIDEVHMLSGHSFNALLKTLEEPPPHVIFLLATTDPQKMPVTVLSRCLQFHLRRMEQQEIIAHLVKILIAEQIEFEEASLAPIAKGADGSMRDALSLLDQAIAFCGDKITLAAVLDMLGTIDRAYAFQLLDSILSEDAGQLMQSIERISEYAPDYDELMSDWLSLLHQIAVAQATQNETDPQINLLSTQIKPADLQLFYQLSLQARKDLAFAPDPRQGFEMAMLRILAFKPQNKGPLPSLKKKHEIIEPTTSQTVIANQITKGQVATNNPSEVATPISNQAIIAQSKTLDSESDLDLVKSVGSTAPPEIEQQMNVSEPAPKLRVVVDNSQTVVNENHLKVTAEPVENAQELKTVTQQDICTGETYQLVALSEVQAGNWFNVVGVSSVTGQGLQILLNSIATYADNTLTVSYLEKVKVLFISSAQSLIEAELKNYFDQQDLKIEFIAVKALSETPKKRRNRLLEQAIDKAEQKLLSDPQVSYLVEHLGATLPRESIKFKD